MCGKRLVFFVSALLLVSGLASGQTSPPSVTYGQKLAELLTISTKAEDLSRLLTLKLQVSQENATKLSQTLDETQAELTKWKADFAEQVTKAELSVQESARLSETVKTLEASLDKSAQDFETYKQASESKVKSLETSRWMIGAGGVAVGLLVGACAVMLTK